MLHELTFYPESAASSNDLFKRPSLQLLDSLLQEVCIKQFVNIDKFLFVGAKESLVNCLHIF